MLHALSYSKALYTQPVLMCSPSSKSDLSEACLGECNVESNRHRSASEGNPSAQHLGVRLTAMLGSHANDIGRLRYSGVVLICTLHKDIFHAGNPVKFCHEIAKPLLGSAIPTHVGGRNRFSFDGQCTELKLVCQ